MPPAVARLVDLDSRPRSTWVLRPDEVYVLEGRLARLQKVGCVLCVAQEGDLTEHQTLAFETSPPAWTCLTHGSLAPLPWVVTRYIMTTIGERTTTTTLVKRSTIYVPTNLTTDDLGTLIEELLAESNDLERAEGDWEPL
jgi:hypothetical protein